MKCLCIYLGALLALIPVSQLNSQPSLISSTNHEILGNLSAMPVTFTENQGQWGQKTNFKAEVGGASFFFCSDEVTYLFVRDTDKPIENGKGIIHDLAGIPDILNRPCFEQEAVSIKARFIGANPYIKPVGEDLLEYKCNYFYGRNPSNWHTDVSSYSAVVYKNLYPGIDLKYYGDGHALKYDFTVQPGADFSKIQIRYEGVDNLDVTPSGALKGQISFGPVGENTPFIYQEIDGVKKQINGHYQMKAPGTFGFSIADGYDQNYPLIIDPQLEYSTFLGGSNTDYAFGIAVDAQGCAYVVGATRSRNFPVADPYVDHLSGGLDIFVTKFSESGTSLAYSTYIGGSDDDEGFGIAVDDENNAYVVGNIYSSDFPTINAYNDTYSGNRDVILLKLSPEGNNLIFSTYLGGQEEDFSWVVAVNRDYEPYITGYTYSQDFPTFHAFDYSQNGADDIFVTKFTSNGNALVYSTYIGGSSEERGFGIGLDGAGCAIVTGFTGSSDFPTTPGAYDRRFHGYRDTFVTKLSTGGDSLLYSTYIGGSGDDGGWRMAVDAKGSAYVTGATFSPNYPMVNAYDSTYNGDRDFFFSKLDPTGSYLSYSTYLGGSSIDYVLGLAIDENHNTYLTGYTTSDDYPMVNPIYSANNGGGDVFVTVMSRFGDCLFSTYLGGGDYEGAYSIAADNQGSIYLTGRTSSYDFPLQNPLNPNFSSGDAFVTKISQADAVGDEPFLPQTAMLLSSYPNPFNAQTTIKYTLPNASNVKMEIFDIAGRKVAAIAEGYQEAGENQVIWNAEGKPSGVYFYKISAGDLSKTEKCVLLK